MKNLFYLFALTLILFSCKQDCEEPQLPNQVGTWMVESTQILIQDNVEMLNVTQNYNLILNDNETGQEIYEFSDSPIEWDLQNDGSKILITKVLVLENEPLYSYNNFNIELDTEENQRWRKESNFTNPEGLETYSELILELTKVE